MSARRSGATPPAARHPDAHTADLRPDGLATEPDGAAIVAGIGARSGVTSAELHTLLDVALREAGLSVGALAAIATISTKASEKGLLDLADDLGVRLVGYSGELLAQVEVPHPSARVCELSGTASVAEAAALMPLPSPAGHRREPSVELLVAKTASVRATVAIARHSFVDLHHHGDAELAPGLLDLAVNVRPDPMPDWLAEAINAAFTRLAAYPNATAATDAVAVRHRRSAGEVLLTAGAAEGFTLLAQGLLMRGSAEAGLFGQSPSTGRALIVHPQFTEPEVAFRAAGWHVDRLVLTPAQGFVLDPAQVPEDVDVVVIGNPTNPTGTMHPRATLRALVRPDRVVVVDEAFMDAVPDEPQSLAAQRSLSGMVVVRSLTKTWGLAGLRIGYLLGDPAVIAAARAVQPHWSVSTPALAAAEACMTSSATREAARRASDLTAERHRLGLALTERGFLVPEQSYGPFLLTRHPDHPGIRTRLRECGIAVRRADTFPGLDEGWIRISIRTSSATDTLVRALDQLIGLP
jgi:histidinol-phosphate aminotransferase